MRPALPAKDLTSDLQTARRKAPAPPWPGDFSAQHPMPIETALQVQFRGVENLIRALDDLTGARVRRRRRR